MTAPDIRGSLLTCSAGGATYGYHRMGSGQDLLLLNGDAMCMSMWTTAFLDQLAASFTVTIFDYPGMGRSTAAADQSWLIPDMARQTRAFIDEIGLHKPALLGWSSGGQIALQMAVHDSSAYMAVASAAGDPGSPHFVGDPEVTTRIAKATPQELVAMLFPADQKDALHAYVADLMSRPQDYPTDDVMAQQESGWRQWLANGIWDQLPSISVPTLLINGDKDELVDPQNARNMADRIPGSRLEIVADAGHAVLLQEPKQMASLVRDFVRTAAAH